MRRPEGVSLREETNTNRHLFRGSLDVYNAVLKQWTVNYEELDVPTCLVGGLFWVFRRGMIKRLILQQKTRKITDILGKGAVLDTGDAAWGKLMEVTLSASARPSLVVPVVFTKQELHTVVAPVLLLNE